MANLDGFLRAAKVQGATDEFLVALLRQHGWPERVVYEALGRIYAQSTGQGLPEPRSTLEAAREAFFHLLAFGTLAIWVFSIGYIWFELIETWFPDPAVSRSHANLRKLSWYIASIIIAFPVFIFATRCTLRDITANPEKIASGIRRWLTNLGLLLNAAVFIGNLVTFLAYFLQGELTSRFVSKSFVVLLLTGGVFLYYLPGLGSRQALPAYSWHRKFALSAGFLILLTLTVGFWKTGSPNDQRQRAEDRRRVEDLHRLATAIQGRWSSTQSLPPTLSQIRPVSPSPQFRLTDPFTTRPYEYLPGDGGEYKICAVFAWPSERGAGEFTWSHPRGRFCFALDAKQNYPYYFQGAF